jgi:hypothetical protein
MKRNSSTGFLLGLAGGVITGLAASIIWFELEMGEYLNDMQKTVDEAKHQDTFLNLGFIRMAENGEIEQLIRAYCTLLQMRLKYIDPESIEDTEFRTKLIKNKNEAELIVARLESEGKCLTNR